MVYLALGIDEEEYREVLGFWVLGGRGKSALSWKEVLVELKTRSLHEPLLVVGDGLTGLGEAAKEGYPHADFSALPPP